MSRAHYLFFLIPLLPLLGVFWNRMAVFVMAGLAWAAFLGVLMNVMETSLFEIFLTQIPVLGFLTFASLRFSQKKRQADQSIENELGLNNIRDLGPEHKALKQAVVKGEKEELKSLQIYGAAKALAEALSWKDMSPRLASSVQKVFGGFEFLLFAYDEENKRTLLQRRGSWSDDFPLNKENPMHCQVYHPGQTSEVIPVLAVPIFSGEGDQARRKGLLIVKPSGDLKEEDELTRIGREFGEQLGMALDKALLFAQMEQHSRIDGLTGVLRRQIFMDRLDEEFKRAAVFHTPFSVMMVDIDHFKGVNDKHGHAAGDAVLRCVGESLIGSVYETDVVGRYGGEEFIILMPRAQSEGALRKAQILREKIENKLITFGFEKIRVTVSIGVAHFPQSGQTKESLISSADKALYEAKEGGRNRVVEG